MTILVFVLSLQAAPERERVNSVGMTLVRIEAGTFTRGSGTAPPRSRAEWESRDADESPAHPVTIRKAYFLGATEVTCAQYRAFDPEKKGADADPVTQVTWDQAVAYCRWLSAKEGKPYRLPSEAEWEYACRAGTTTAFSTGDAVNAEQAHFKGSKPLPVGGRPANPWGLFDMHGNVSEWCLDWYGDYAADAAVDPVGPFSGAARVTRGGNFLMGSPRHVRSANRSGHLPDDANRATGFRVAQADALDEPADRKVAVVPAEGPDPRVGPDPATPYFLDYGKENLGPKIPKDAWGPVFGAWNHYAALCALPDGSLLAAWYTTLDEAGRELAQAGSVLPAGKKQWTPAELFFDVPDVNDHAPVLLAHGGRVYHFFTQSLRGWDDAAVCLRIRESGAAWSAPRIILSRNDPRHLSQPTSAFAAADGTIVLACDGDGHRDERLLLSSDRGQTWTVAKGDLRKASGKNVLHPAIVPRADGAVLAFLRGADPMPLLASTDRGETWEPQELSFPGIGVGQKAAALRLASGALLLVSFDDKRKQFGGGAFAALSTDEGRMWPHVRRVDGVTGYLSAAQSPNGVLTVFGSKMTCVSFNEAWVKAGK